MSSEKQDKSISTQRDELLRLAKRRGYTIRREYVDEAISGDDTEKRDGFLRLRQDCEDGPDFSIILCWHEDRLSRNDPLELGYWLKPIRDAGVVVETPAGRVDWDTLGGRLVYLIGQEMRHDFLQQLSRNTTRGLLASAREGRAGTGGPNPFGYHSADGEVSIVEPEAVVVRLIFAEYLKPGASLRGLAAKLNRSRTSPPRGKVWRCSSVRSILTRAKYCGSFVYGSRNAGKYFAMRDGEVIPRRKSDKATSAEPIVLRDHFAAIVDQGTFDKVQRKLAGRRGNTAPKSARRYILSGLCKCGDCGGSMGGIGGSMYRCRMHHQSGTSACFNNAIGEAPLVACIVRMIQERYLGEAALARLRRKIEAKLAERDLPPTRRDLDRLRREIEDLDRKIGSAEDAVLDAPSSLRGGLYRRLESRKAERDRLQVELEALGSRETRSGSGDRSVVDQAIEALRSLGEALRKASPENTRELLASIVSRIELHFDHKPAAGGRHKNTFREGTIYLRPDAGEVRSSEPKSSHMSTKGSFVGASRNTDGLLGQQRDRQLGLGQAPPRPMYTTWILIGGNLGQPDCSAAAGGHAANPPATNMPLAAVQVSRKSRRWIGSVMAGLLGNSMEMQSAAGASLRLSPRHAAAGRRGSRTRMAWPPARPASRIAGGTRVVFPAPVGAQSTTFPAARSASIIWGKTVSIRSGQWAWDRRQTMGGNS
jgi:DNA invertase Pin-like site-specific DNA recombinase